MAQSVSTRPVLAALNRQRWTCTASLSSTAHCQKKLGKPKPPPVPPPLSAFDHRKLGRQQELFFTSIYSPGSPILLPNGTHIFNRLVDFLRGQYVRFGFKEVITPTIYKKALWAKSGHLENYAEDMYSVTGKTRVKDACCSGHLGETTRKTTEGEVEDDETVRKADEGEEDDGEYGLKPMNCPGHCLIFASKRRSYRDLPIRYADFSPLHRNEVSGALTGLTRVRRFHQDDGHIFCRPLQVEDEIKSTLDFVKYVYSNLFPKTKYRLVLSTRPKDHFIGTLDEWDRAEGSLKRALDESSETYTINEGDGAFYGPKIDIILTDWEGKEHQTATIQLDFQLPKRFELEYVAPAPEFEARGQTTLDETQLKEYGLVRPVMIHRAVLGSVERLMALLIEHHRGEWPFWLNPNQVIILTVNNDPAVESWAETVRDVLIGRKSSSVEDNGDVSYELCEMPLATGLTVEIDNSARSMGRKIVEAREKKFGQILIVGNEEAEKGSVAFDREQSLPPAVLQSLQQKARRITSA